MPVVEYILKGDAKGVESAFGSATKAAGATAAAVLAVGKAYNKLIADTVAVVDQVNTLAHATGLTTDAINGLRLAAKASGKTLTDIVPTKLAKNMLTASQGATEMQRAFKAAGVEFENIDGSVRDANKAFPELIDSLGSMENKTLAAGLAAQIMGKQGRELLTAFEDQEGFQKFVDLGNEFGIKTGPAAVKAAGEWQAATANLSLAFENAGASFLETFGGSGFVTQTMEAFSLGFVALTQFMADVMSGIFDNIQAGTKAVRKALEGDLIGAEYALLELKATGDIVGDAFDSAWDKALKFWELQTREAPKAAEAVGGDGPGSFVGALRDVNEELSATLDLLELGDLSSQMFGEADAFADDIDTLVSDLQRVGDELDDLTNSRRRQGFRQVVDQSITAVGAWGHALQGFAKEGSKAYRDFFNLQQAAASAGILVDTARGISMAMAIPPPAGPALALAIAATGAAQLANVAAVTINGQGSISTPNLPGTGASGQQQGGTTRSGPTGPTPEGFDEAFAAATEGVPVVIQFRHEIYDATVPDSSKIPGSALSKLKKNGVKVGHRGKLSINPVRALLS